MIAKGKAFRILKATSLLLVVLFVASCPNPVLDQINQRLSNAHKGTCPFTSFTFTAAANAASGVSIDCVGTINGTDVTIAVPYGSRVAALVATFEAAATGAVKVNGSTQTSGSTAKDFTNPVQYTLTASDGTTYSGEVTVSIAPAGVVLNTSAQTLAAGGAAYTLQAQVSPNDPSATLVWTSSNTSVVRLTQGVVLSVYAGAVWQEFVIPVGVGNATVTVKTADGTKSASCSFTVTPPVAVTGVSLSTTTLGIALGASTQYLSPTIAPSNATNTFVTWSSSTPAVATIDANGAIAPVALGYTVVTVTTLDGNKTATCLVNVTPPVAVSGVSISPASVSMAVTSGGQSVTATLAPTNATNQKITWSSSDTSVATVTNYGSAYAYITPVGTGGPITITATTADGGKAATCTVTVTAPVAVSTISLIPTTLALSVGGSTGWISSSISPSSATNQNVTWSTDNSAVASIVNSYSNSATITAVAAGTAIITGTTQDGAKTATCVVNVSPRVPVYSVSVSTPGQPIAVNGSGYCSATVLPANATNSTLAWSSNNPLVVTVDSSANLRGIGAGTTMITATATDGSNKSGSASVTVGNITGIALPAGFHLSIGGSQYLTPTITPTFYSNPNVTWTSSNTNVATVTNFNGQGYVFAYGGGTATITAKSTDSGAVQGTTTVTVP
jgi:uncharacterized protein YjdB